MNLALYDNADGSGEAWLTARSPPQFVRLVNGIGECINRLGLRPINLSPERLMAKASRQTGLSDWGEGDFLSALPVLLESYESEANLSLVGRAVEQQTILRLLTNRLKAQRDFTEHPEILRQSVDKPLFIFGLPRTGTTLLFNLMARTPGARAPLWWELFQPSPPPVEALRQTDSRIAEAERANRIANRIFPDLRSLHETTATSPEECLFVFQMTFSTVYFGMAHMMQTYVRWLMQHDMVPAYRYYRSILQLLQWQSPGQHWVMKSPHHLFHLDALLRVFPDACIVHLHRDVTKVVGSACSMIAMLRRVYGRREDPENLGPFLLEVLATGVDRTMKIREQTSADGFYDLHYTELMANPKRQVERICEHFGRPFDERTSTELDSWMNSNRQHKHGVHNYALEQFGLNEDRVNARFAEYISRYGVSDHEAPG